MLDTHEEALGRAYESTYGSLVRRLTAICRDPHDAEDLAHEAYVRLALEMEAGRGPDDPAAWLHRVGWNLAMSRGRHRTVVARHEAHLPRPDAPAEPDRTAIDRETSAAIFHALAALAGTERAAVVLAAEGFRGVEVATAIGRTVGATRTLLCRARAKLRTSLEPDLATSN